MKYFYTGRGGFLISSWVQLVYKTHYSCLRRKKIQMRRFIFCFVFLNSFIFLVHSLAFATPSSLKELAAKKVAATFAQQQPLLTIPQEVAPSEVLGAIASYLSPSDFDFFQNDEASKTWYQLKVNRIEGIMNQFGAFIPLSLNSEWSNSKDAISPVAPTQELWVEVLGVNPAYFKEKKYCPDTYKEVGVNGVKIGMCPDFPVERVIAIDRGNKDSDEEFMAALKRIYTQAGLHVEFRRPTYAEYDWADTEGGTRPKLATDPDFGKATPNCDISNKDPLDLTKPSPSGDEQPRSMLMNAPNAFGFRRSGVWEWIHEDIVSSKRSVVGGSWYDFPKHAVSGYRDWFRQNLLANSVGPSRLVKIVRHENN
jgi:hypothetical protein